ncbi:MAG: hypothetical protein IAF38_20640 [Bacteroidia bacterium]|nr:hypothetical protein [Bacteroidia bacterium]
MNAYFKIMTWMYMLTGFGAAAMTVYFQLKGMRDEAIYSLIAAFVCGAMLGLRSWQRKRIEKLNAFMQEKQEREAKEKKESRKKK